MDHVIYQILTCQELMKELEMTDQQSPAVRALRGERSGNLFGHQELHRRRLAELIEEKAQDHAPLQAIFLDSQWAWLRQVELQVRLAPCVHSCGLLAPELMEKLKLTASQIEAIAHRERAFGEAVQEMEEAFVERMNKSISSALEKMLAVLSDEQRHTYEAWLSKAKRPAYGR